MPVVTYDGAIGAPLGPQFTQIDSVTFDPNAAWTLVYTAYQDDDASPSTDYSIADYENNVGSSALTLLFSTYSGGSLWIVVDGSTYIGVVDSSIMPGKAYAVAVYTAGTGSDVFFMWRNLTDNGAWNGPTSGGTLTAVSTPISRLLIAKAASLFVNPFKGGIGMYGQWSSVLSGVDAMVDTRSSQDWHALAPDFLLQFNAAPPIIVDGAATRTSSNGTLGPDFIPDWTYIVPGAPQIKLPTTVNLTEFQASAVLADMLGAVNMRADTGVAHIDAETTTMEID